MGKVVRPISIYAADQRPTPAFLNGDQHWKFLSDRGNTAFAEKRWGEAESLYAHALIEADRIFDAFRLNNPIPGADAPPMLVVSVANAAENWLCMGQARRAGEALISLSRRLCEAIEDEHLALDLRRQCFLHLKVAVAEVMDKLPRAGVPTEVLAETVEQARTIALHFIGRHAPNKH